MKDLSFNTFNELKLYAEEGGESLEQWLSEVGDPLDHNSVPNDKYIKRMLKDKDERMKLRNYNSTRIIKHKVKLGDRLTDEDFKFILFSKVFRIQELDRKTQLNSFEVLHLLKVSFAAENQEYIIRYFANDSGDYLRAIGYAAANNQKEA